MPKMRRPFSFTRFFKLARGAGLVTQLLALWRLMRHAATPRAPKLVAMAVLAYALSPIDLIPDFIPVLGLLDDLILIPLGVALLVRLTPAPLWRARLAEARVNAERLPSMLWGAAFVIVVWLALIGVGVWWWLGRGA